jgi:hypothetical protein
LLLALAEQRRRQGAPTASKPEGGER